MSINRWMDKEDVIGVCVCVCVCVTQPWKEWNNAICSNMDRPRDHHTKWSKPDKDKYHDLTYVESKKLIQMTLLTKQKQTHRYRK